MSKNICKVGMATRCDYKRNVKPHTVCAHYAECIYQELIEEKTHGKTLLDAAEKIEVK